MSVFSHGDCDMLWTLTARWQEKSDVKFAGNVIVNELNDSVGSVYIEAVKQRETAVCHDRVTGKQRQTVRRQARLKTDINLHKSTENIITACRPLTPVSCVIISNFNIITNHCKQQI